MKIMLLAAGIGTRLQPLTYETPKCLIDIQGKPLLAHWLGNIEKHGIKQVLINTSYLSEKVVEFVDNYNTENLDIKLVHEDNLLGTAGTIEHNTEFIANSAFICAHADNLSNFDITAFIKAHQQRENMCHMTMLTFLTDQPEQSGIVEIDEKGIVQAFHEKNPNPPSNLANGAVYIFEPEIVEIIQALPIGLKDLSTQVIPHYVNRIQTYFHDGIHRDIGNLESLQKARELYSN